MDPHDDEVAARTRMDLGDTRRSGQQRRKNLCRTESQESTAGHRSARAVMGKTSAAAVRVKYFRCGKPRHGRRDCGKQVCGAATPGSHAGRERGTACVISRI